MRRARPGLIPVCCRWRCPFWACYGMQILARTLGGRVAGSGEAEYGPADVELDPDVPLFRGLPPRQQVWMSHGDRVDRLPDGFRGAARSPASPVAAMMHPEKQWYGLQFHPEVSHTPAGTEILRRFVVDVCGAPRDWTMAVSYTHLRAHET